MPAVIQRARSASASRSSGSGSSASRLTWGPSCVISSRSVALALRLVSTSSAYSAQPRRAKRRSAISAAVSPGSATRRRVDPSGEGIDRLLGRLVRSEGAGRLGRDGRRCFVGELVVIDDRLGAGVTELVPVCGGLGGSDVGHRLL